VFAKAPVPGQVKTRLADGIGSEEAAVLYRQLLEQTVARAVASGLAPVELQVTPDKRHPSFTTLADRYAIPITLQTGGDLGQRMAAALRSALQDSDFVLLIGTDCPAMDEDYLLAACELLDKGADAVVGPAEDGGYVLIGLRRFDARLFNDIPWSSGQVMDTTRERLRSLGWRWEELPALWDLDRPEDLLRWQRETRLLTPVGFASPTATRRRPPTGWGERSEPHRSTALSFNANTSFQPDPEESPNEPHPSR